MSEGQQAALDEWKTFLDESRDRIDPDALRSQLAAELAEERTGGACAEPGAAS